MGLLPQSGYFFEKVLHWFSLRHQNLHVALFLIDLVVDNHGWTIYL